MIFFSFTTQRERCVLRSMRTLWVIDFSDFGPTCGSPRAALSSCTCQLCQFVVTGNCTHLWSLNLWYYISRPTEREEQPAALCQPEVTTWTWVTVRCSSCMGIVMVIGVTLVHFVWRPWGLKLNANIANRLSACVFQHLDICTSISVFGSRSSHLSVYLLLSLWPTASTKKKLFVYTSQEAINKLHPY